MRISDGGVLEIEGLLKDRDPGVRSAAASALGHFSGRISDGVVWGEIVELLKSDHQTLRYDFLQTVKKNCDLISDEAIREAERLIPEVGFEDGLDVYSFLRTCYNAGRTLSEARMCTNSPEVS